LNHLKVKLRNMEKKNTINLVSIGYRRLTISCKELRSLNHRANFSGVGNRISQGEGTSLRRFGKKVKKTRGLLTFGTTWFQRDGRNKKRTFAGSRYRWREYKWGPPAKRMAGIWKTGGDKASKKVHGTETQVYG